MYRHGRLLCFGLILLSVGLGTACTLVSPPMSERELVNYTSEKFGYSIDYPKGWRLEQMNPNVIGIAPSDTKYNLIYISAYPREPMIGLLPDQAVATHVETNIQKGVDGLGGQILLIFENERTSGKWDWEAGCFFTHKDATLKGLVFIKETESTSYIAQYISISAVHWTAGEEVINSFRLTE